MLASELFNQLYQNSSKALNLFRSNALSPNKSKTLREWGIADAAKMVGRTPQTLRTLEEQNKLPKARTTSKGKRTERVYNLEEINKIRDYFSTRPKKPTNAPPAIIAITNFKGGATKSTTATNLSQNLALKGYRILNCDGDNQGTMTHMNGLIPDQDVSPDNTLLNILIGKETNIEEVIIKTHWPGIDLVPANLSLFNAELIIPSQIAEHSAKTGQQLAFYSRLRNALKSVSDKYDVIILDAPPSLGMITMNILYAANAVIIPMPPNIVDYASTTQFLNMVYETFERLPNVTYSFVRFLLSRFKVTSLTAKDIEAMTRQFLGQFVMTNYMIESEAVSKAAADLKTIYEVEPHNNERKTFNRAIGYEDRVCDEIEMLIKIMWENHLQMERINKTKEVAA